jgi:hypothetical protein
MAEPFIATRVYLKPLLPNKQALSGSKMEAVLRQTKTELMRRVKAKLYETAFSRRAKKSLAKFIKIQVKPSSLQVTSTHPAFGPLVMGQKKQQMRWLRKAKRPIPIILDTGELIFRNATARSMKNGKWKHPGRPPSDFIDRAKSEAREFIKAQLKKEMKKQITSARGRR